MAQPGRILIIDDAEAMRSFIASALRRLGYAPEMAADGAHGVALFDAGEVWDLVLLEHPMRHVAGLEVLRLLRQRDPAARVIMMTAHDPLDLVLDAMRHGAADFLRKPFSLETLAGAVAAALAKTEAAKPASEAAVSVSAAAKPRCESPLLGCCLLNGFRFWPAAPVADESTAKPQVAEVEIMAGHIERAFTVRLPSGETRRCVIVMNGLRDLMQQATGRHPPPPDPLWDTACAHALANYLWQKSAVPTNALAATDLSVDQLEMLLGSAIAR